MLFKMKTVVLTAMVVAVVAVHLPGRSAAAAPLTP